MAGEDIISEELLLSSILVPKKRMPLTMPNSASNKLVGVNEDRRDQGNRLEPKKEESISAKMDGMNRRRELENKVIIIIKYLY